MILLKDRSSAGKALAHLLKKYQRQEALILALPRGGVPVAWVIAQELKLPWDLLLVKKIGLPGHEEFAIGAIAELGNPIWDSDSVKSLKLSDRALNEAAHQSRQKILAQSQKWREQPPDVKGRVVIVVDDGLATGLTMKAAIDYLRQNGAATTIAAAPVASVSAKESLSRLADEVVVLATPEPFYAVGQWYEDFSEVTDEEVTLFLQAGKVLHIPVNGAQLPGSLTCPYGAKGLIIFAHGSGSGYQSPRNQAVARNLNEQGLATLLCDLVTVEEGRDHVFDIPFLAARLKAITAWVRASATLKGLPLGYFGASTGAAAALVAAASDPDIKAIVSRGGRPDLAREALGKVGCPTLLIVGGEDHEVIELNRKASALLKDSELVVVPLAGHLFEEPGTLDKVKSLAGDWFLQKLSQQKAAMKSPEFLVEEIKSLYSPMTAMDHFDRFLQAVGQSRVVMLGEATHGTEEFYQIRKTLSQRLIQDYGFRFIAVEGDWPDCYRLNQYLQGKAGHSVREVMRGFKRWPTWMWANHQVEDLIESLKGRDAFFYGLDVYSFRESLDQVKAYAHKLNPDMSRRLLEAYSCLDPFRKDEMAYAKSLLKWPEGCAEEIQKNLRELLRLRLEATNLEEPELFDLQQNAKILNNAEQYYRAMVRGDHESWNIRDEHMMETLDSLLRYHGEGAKAVVWAHNTHIGDYHATDMLREGYINLGGLARERYGMDEVKLVGFGTYQGEVLAGRAWGAKPEVMPLPAAPAPTYEYACHQIAETLNVPVFYLLLGGKGLTPQVKGHRAVGVVYQPALEAHGRNYVATDLAHRYDAFIFVDRTTALKMIPVEPEKGALPETFPVGV